MAFITTTNDRTFSLREALIQFRDALKQLPLGEERYTRSTHARDFGAVAAGDGQRKASDYRPTYALQIV